MLVLSRKLGESIVIADNIELVVLGVEGDTVKLGINAPKNIGIFRKEIYLSIQESNKEASNTRLISEELGDLYKKSRNIE